MRSTTTGFCTALVLVFAATAFSQTKSVTNADLEKFRVKRLAAEKELRENYEQLGFPSPEELAKQEEESRRARAAIVQDLRRREVEEARREYEAAQQALPVTVFPYPNPSFVDYGGRLAPSYLYYRSYYPYGVRRYPGNYRYGNYRFGREEPGRFRTFRRMWRDATRSRTHRR